MGKILKLILDIRDFTFLWLLKTEGKEYAEREYEFRVSAFFVIYYYVFLISILLIAFPFFSMLRISQETSNFLKYSIFSKIIGGFFLLSPYYFISQKFIVFLSKFPIESNCNDDCYKQKRNKTIICFILGATLIPVVGAISNLLRMGHF